MKSSGYIGKKKSTCLYLDKKIVGTAREMGMNFSKVSENALKEAIERLMGQKPEPGLESPAPPEGRDRDLNPGAGLHRPVG